MNQLRPGLFGAGLIAVALALVMGTGCRQAGSSVLGTSPTGLPTSVSALSAAPGPGGTNASVMLEGVMVEKCPVAGCWFKLQDQTGIVKVDTKFAGFVVLDVPLRTTVSVAGHVEEQGKERVLVATGLRY